MKQTRTPLFLAALLAAALFATACGGDSSDENTPDTPVLPSEEATLTGIAVSMPPSKTDYTVNDEFDAAGLSITASYSTGEPKHIAYPNKNMSLSQPDMTTKGTKPVTVTYTEGGVSKDTYFDITVDSKEEQPQENGDFTIAIKTEPYKTEYEADEALSLSGLTLTVTYKDGTTQDVVYVWWNAESITAAEEPYTPEEAGDALTLAYEDGMVWSGEAAAVAGKDVTITYDPPTVDGAPQVDVLGLAAYRLAIEKAQGSGGTRKATVTVAYTENGKPATARYTITRATEQNGTVTIDGTGWEGKEDVVYSLNFSGDNISKMKSFVDPKEEYVMSSKGDKKTKEIIPGVDIITSIYKDSSEEYAQAFDFGSKNVNVSLSGNTYDLSGYKGGIITTGSVSWDNLASQTFTGRIQVGQLKDTLDLVYGNKMDYPTMNNISIGDCYDPLVAGSDSYVNLYGQNLDTIIKKYYDSNNNTKFSFADGREFARVGNYKFDAKSALNGESMYNNGSVNSSLYELDLNALLLMHTFVDNVKNVKITGINKTGLSNTGMHMSNVVFQSDVSDMSFTGNVYGLIDFAVAPKSVPGGAATFKLILRSVKDILTLDGIFYSMDLSEVPISDVINIKIAPGGFYEMYFQNLTQANSVDFNSDSRFHVGRIYYKDENSYETFFSLYDKGKTLTNEQWEKVGNGETDLLSRANPINQTLMQRLLDDNQHYYG